VVRNANIKYTNTNPKLNPIPDPNSNPTTNPKPIAKLTVTVTPYRRRGHSA